MTSLSFKKSNSNRVRMLTVHQRLDRQLEQLNADQRAAERAMNERISELRLRLRYQSQAVSLPLDEIRVPAVRLSQINVVDNTSVAARRLARGPKSAAAAAMAVSDFQDKRKQKSAISKERDVVKKLDGLKSSVQPTVERHT